MDTKTLLTGIVLVNLLCACSTLPPVEDEEVIPHIISIGRDGEHEEILAGQKIQLNPGEEKVTKLASTFDPVINGLKEFSERQNGKTNVLIYVHGGLNTSKTSFLRAQEKYSQILDAKKYPIFVNWRSGAVTTYTSHLTRIRQGEISKTAPLTSPIYLLTDIANSLVNTPKSWLVTGIHSYESTQNRDDHYLEEYRNGTNGVYYTGSQDDSLSLKRRAQWILGSPVKLVSTPFTYTMAKPAWDIMLRRTNTPFYSPSDLENKVHSTEYGIGSGSGALYRFLIELEKLITDENLDVEITLVGHSMGAIVINKMLSLDVELPYKNIVHMASADSIDNLFNHVIPYMSKENNDDVSFYSLSLHPENEDREVSAWGATPSGSLLVWIDNMFTVPETVMNKRSGRWENMDRALPLIPKETRDRMFFKIFGLNHSGESSLPDGSQEPQKHGDFDEIPFWDERAWRR